MEDDEIMTARFWRAAGIRAVRTACQTAVAMLPAVATIDEVSWLTVASTAAYAAVCSVLTSVWRGLPEASDG